MKKVFGWGVILLGSFCCVQPVFSKNESMLLLERLRQMQGLVAQDEARSQFNIGLEADRKSAGDRTTDLTTRVFNRSLLRFGFQIADKKEGDSSQQADYPTIAFKLGDEQVQIVRVYNDKEHDLYKAENDRSSVTFGFGQTLGQFRVSERLNVDHRFALENQEHNSNTFYGGEVAGEYTVKWSDKVARVETAYSRAQNFQPRLDTRLHESDTYAGRITLFSPKWFIESMYQNEFIDDEDDYYTTQNTVGYQWNLGPQQSALGVIGVQHRRTNLNPRELLGMLLMFSFMDTRRVGGWDSNERELLRSGSHFEFFFDPTGGNEGDDLSDAWEISYVFNHSLGYTEDFKKDDHSRLVIEVSISDTDGQQGKDYKNETSVYFVWEY